MDFLGFMIFGVLELSAIYFLIFRLFKIDLYVFSIVFASVLSNFISYTLREVYHLTSSDIIIQMLLMVAFCWQLFRIQLFYSVIMVSIGYIAFVALQTTLFLLANWFKLVPDVLNPTSPIAYILQTVSACFTFGAGWFVHKSKKGFNFVPHSPQKNVLKEQSKNAWMLLLYCTATLVPLLLSVIFALSESNKWFFVIPIASCLILWALLYWAYKKEQSYD